MANKLINEQSPYLLQHANNPVDWYPWGEEAFERAAREHKPVIVSIGYAACHWCHVMEHESFENEATAAYMNEHFVCVKVDREEHPDVDHLYMDAVQAIAGNGGWPLNVFVTPERAPFYGGTYYPPKPAYNRPSWIQLLERMNEIWTTQPDEVAHQSGQLIQHLQQASLRLTGDGKEPDMETCRQIADSLLKQADNEKGGFGSAPKFPGTMAISFLLEHYHYTRYEPALKHALFSLDAMIAGGIYDQLAGGFARYSTDREWLAPHFEKMLYDNALLVSALCDAFSVSANESYKRIIEDTIQFAETELKDAGGGYYCALDADSEGEEGKFYTWTWDEWVASAGADNPIAEAYFGITKEGNWEGTNILHVATTAEEIAKREGIAINEVTGVIESTKHKLLAARQLRVRPQTDDKCLLSWNALMNLAVCKAAVVFMGSDASLSTVYMQRAVAHMQWMLQQFYVQRSLMHTWKNGTARIPAKLDDYAYLIQALLQLGQATGDKQWVVKAIGLTEEADKEFRAEKGFYYYTPVGQKDIPVRKVDNYDGATPSANAFMAQNLWICGMCTDKTDWVVQSGEMLNALSGTIKNYSYSFGYWAILLQRQAIGQRTIIVSGPEAANMAYQVGRQWLPHAYLLTLDKEIFVLPVLENKYFKDKTCIFVCSGQACLSPVTSVNQALELVNHYKV
jgi:uncharacterized protein YyaL (SSP411 family)